MSQSDDVSAEDVAICLSAVVLVPLAFLSAFYTALIAWLAWKWFAVPYLNFPAVPFLVMYALMIAANLYKPISTKPTPEITAKMMWTGTMVPLLIRSIMLGELALIHIFY